MRKCAPEGDLRAYLDREGGPEALSSVEEHLRACPTCRDALDRLARRADSVASLLGALPEPPVIAAPLEMPRSASPKVRWAPAALALAACLAVVFVIAATRSRSPQATAPAETPAVSDPAVAYTAPPSPKPEVEVRETAPVKAASRVRREPAKSEPPSRNVRYFVALDDEPIEMGLIMRVALGPQETPADVVFSPDGRARAIRLVSYSNLNYSNQGAQQ